MRSVQDSSIKSCLLPLLKWDEEKVDETEVALVVDVAKNEEDDAELSSVDELKPTLTISDS